MKELEDIISIIATLIGILLNITPIIIFSKIMRRKENDKIISQSILFYNIICSELWMIYWYRINKKIPMISASIDFYLSLFFIIIYFYFLQEKKFLIWIFSCFIILDLSFQVYYISIYIIKNDEIIGIITMIFNIITSYKPFQNIFKIMKEGNYKMISIFDTILGCFCAFFWLIYGILIKNYKAIIPNFIGFIISFIHILLYTVFYLKRKKNDEKKEKLNYKEIEED